MAKTAAGPELRVEGRDDLATIATLLEKYGITLKLTNWAARIVDVGSVDDLLEGVQTAVRTGSGRRIGFVLDADQSVKSRWESIRHHLQATGVASLPKTPDPQGFVGASTTYKTRVGVWIMPDNKSSGMLEDFLQQLVDQHDSLLEHAFASTDKAKQDYHAKFPDTSRSKAVIHAWLAWQERPGKPFGQAFKANYFRHNHPAAERFVEWYRRLFETS